MTLASVRVRGGGLLRRFYSGDIRRGGGKFGEREHAQEEQYFRKKEREEIEKYRQEMDEAAKKKVQDNLESPPEKSKTK